MTELTQDLSLAQACSLMNSYAFDLGRDDADRLVDCWLDLYQPNWIRLATIEALYLGRYKAISIEHILNVWLRIGTPNPHFTYEFERLICRKLPKHLSDLSNLTANASRTHSLSSVNTALPAVTQTNIVDNGVIGVNLNLQAGEDCSSSASIPAVSHWGLSYNPIWSDLRGGSKIIHQFIPLPDVSSFFARLKMFGEEKP
ncbi:MAG: hypothetical protein AAF652_01280 [Cyanobacteria bacterium P01_C01_bin.72]